MTGFEAFVNEITARLNGPLGFRFIIQPIIAILLGIIDGIKDARSGLPPYLIYLLFHPEIRGALLKSAGVSAVKPIIIGIITDAIAQYLIFNTVRPVEAVFLGTMIIAIPYVLSRGLTNRIVSFKGKLR